MKDLIANDKPQKIRTIVVVLTLLLGIIIGLLLHDTLIQQVVNSFDIKSWYPR